MELFPVSVRSSALGVANVFGRLAAIFAPQAANVPAATLMVCLGLLSLCVGAACLVLPETMKRHVESADCFSGPTADWQELQNESNSELPATRHV